MASGDVFVFAQSSASSEILAQADQTSGAGLFNGDDAIVLRKGGTNGTIVDVIGQIGVDPGTEWGTGLTSTADNTLRRKSSITMGDTNPNDAFDPSVEWDGFATNTFDGLGSHTTNGNNPGVTLTQAGGSTDVNEAGETTDTYTIALNTVPTGAVEIAIAADAETQISSDGVNFFASVTLSLSNTDAQTITVRAVDDPDTEGSPHTGVISHSITSSADPNYSDAATPIPNLNVNVTDNDVAVMLTPIYTIQGTGDASPFAGNNLTYTTEGVVVGDFQGSTGLNGFYIQDATGDADSATSDGIFVFAPNSIDVNVGDVVRVTGEVSEFFNLTQIDTLSSLSVVGSGSVTPTALDLPVSAVSDLESYEGMLVTFPETLTVTENFNLARFGQVSLSADGRLFNPTNFIDPTDMPTSGTENDENNVAAVTEQQNLNNTRQILLDDGSNSQNPTSIPYLNADNTLRNGDTTTNLTGVLDYGFGDYRLQPTVTPTFEQTNPRTAAPEEVGGNVKVASFNVLNYFNGDGMGGGFPTSRGASSAVEFERQSDKIVSAIAAIDADVVGLIEVENDGDGADSAIAELVNRLNTFLGAPVYDYIRDPATGVGTDEIKTAFIYKPDVVTPLGQSLSDTDDIYNRFPVAQTFILNSNGETFTPVVNHFKSKSGTGEGLDADQGDGQGAFNFTRVQQAEALLGFVDDLKTSTGDSDVLVIGDLNAYGEEDPIDVLRNGGLTDEIERFVENPYSFVFDGQSGYLDHALTTSTLSPQVSGVTEWHINADEPRILDYNLEFKGANASPDLYTPTPYRSSDHDPVIIGLDLSSTLAVQNGGNGSDALNGTSGRDELNGGNGSDILNGGNGNDTLNGGNAKDTLNGGSSNDILVGANGDDLLNGGQGDDILTGGQGSDRFILAAGEGSDTITDFKDGTDFIGLSGGLLFEQLTIVQGTGADSANTLIGITSSDELLAVLTGVNATTINTTDFVTV
ncbi:MAG: ExeM/NucH family extracellular endonuclease [Microcoleus sp. SIO2G3]|nr:ExeM/NucH family extracellular endonuclease [Microcoleus sp. SIO2G3]